ncbi:5'-nucleotidase surE [Senna tora]|uniref:5'-nucleotidase surE n=1 Tax=Senna tora TaxID=362788 RepID=A0A834WRE0_9FABA|nr:5'-nucleotidase surE [Senna tora]
MGHLNYVKAGKRTLALRNDEKDAVSVCLPLIHATIRDIKKGIFPNNCFLNIGIHRCPLRNKRASMVIDGGGAVGGGFNGSFSPQSPLERSVKSIEDSKADGDRSGGAGEGGGTKWLSSQRLFP